MKKLLILLAIALPMLLSASRMCRERKILSSRLI